MFSARSRSDNDRPDSGWSTQVCCAGWTANITRLVRSCVESDIAVQSEVDGVWQFQGTARLHRLVVGVVAQGPACTLFRGCPQRLVGEVVRIDVRSDLFAKRCRCPQQAGDTSCLAVGGLD